MSQEDISELLPSGYVIDDKFEVVSLIGSGGHSDVYKARHRLLDNMVAIKVIHRNLLESEKAILRFQREASTLNSLQHENIVRFLSFGQLTDGRSYLAQELIPGQTLDQILSKEKSLDPARALNIICNVSRGLKAAHQNNIVHRDIKPANIAVFIADGEEHAKILDFGIHKNTEMQKEQSLTATGQILGSFLYASPEQCTNKPIKFSSDVYSLGSVFYEMLCGSAPCEDESELLIMNNQVYKEISKIPSSKPIPESLSKIIIKCLKKNPEQRFQSAEDLDFALKQIELESNRWRPFAIPVFLILIATISIYSVLAYYSKQKADVDSAIPKKVAAKFSTSRNSSPPPIADSNEITKRQQDEWLDFQIYKCSIDDALDAWCASAGARQRLKVASLPLYGDYLEKGSDKHLATLHSKQGVLNFLDRYVRFLGYSKKYKKAIALVDGVKTDPGENEYSRKKLNCLVSLAQLGAPLDQKALLLQRLKYIEDVPLVAWDDYFVLARMEAEAGNTAKQLMYLKKAVDSSKMTRQKNNEELIQKGLYATLALATVQFSLGYKAEGRKTLRQFESFIPKSGPNQRIYNVEADVLAMGDESDWTILVNKAKHANCDEMKAAASVLAKYAMFLETKNKTEEALAQLKSARQIYVDCAPQAHPQITGNEFLARISYRQIQYGEIGCLIAMALDKLNRNEEAKKSIHELLKNESLQPYVRMTARSLQASIDFKDDPKTALKQHKLLFEETTKSDKFANNQTVLIGQIVSDYQRLNGLPEARQFLVTILPKIWTPNVKTNTKALIDILDKHPDNWVRLNQIQYERNH